MLTASQHESTRPSHADFIAQRHFGSLDGLRALSILAVVWHHAVGAEFAGGRLGYFGAEGVSLFFAISGFLITTLLLRERDRNGFVDLRAFYVRRSLRIFPLYYAVLLLYVVLVFVLERSTPVGKQFFENLVYFLTYTANWFVVLDGRVIFYFAWSLAAEEQFYLVWPPLMSWLKTIERSLVLLTVVASGLVAVELAFLLGLPLPGGLLWFALKIPLAIIFGVMAALTLHMPQGFKRLAPLVADAWASWVWLAVVAGALVWPGAPRFLLHLAMVGLVMACVVNPRHGLAGPLSWPPLAYVGKISYGLYLLHLLGKNVAVKLVQLAAPEPAWPWVFAATLLVSVMLASLSFRYFESIFMARKSRFER